MKELLELDKNFNKEMFITKVNNIFIMLHTALMTDNLDRVRHYLSEELEKHYENVLEEYNKRNEKVIYDELNVKNTEIKEVVIKDNLSTIYVDITSRYMEYITNKETGEYIKGNNCKRVEKKYHLVFQKGIDSNYNSVIRKCPTCGSSIDVNKTGKCPFCRNIFNAEDYDWILISINN